MQAELESVSDKPLEKKIGWWDLPLEMREMVIKQMDAETRVSFLLCSDDCAAEIPKNFLNGVRFVNSRIVLAVCQSDEYFILDFKINENGGFAVIFTRFHLSLVWRVVEMGDFFKVVARYFQKIINTVTDLEFIDIDSPSFPFELTTIRHVKKVENFMLAQTLPNDLFENGFMGPDQLCYVTDTINLHCLPLKCAQLQRMKSPIICVSSVFITSEDVNHYLKLFQNDKLHNSFDVLVLKMARRSELDTDKVINGLNVIGKQENSSVIHFALVSNLTSPKIASVSLKPSNLKVVIYSKEKFNVTFHGFLATAVDDYFNNASK